VKRTDDEINEEIGLAIDNPGIYPGMSYPAERNALVLPEPSDSWKACRFCTPRQACSQHREEAKRYYDLVRRGATARATIVRPADPAVEVSAWECASHEIETAPGYRIFVTGWLDGKRQTLAIDPDEVDELARRLHAAKRVSRKDGSSVA
jgi:hypothetical protein